MSCASEASHASFSRPALASTSSDEPTLTTMRRKSARAGVLDIARLSTTPNDEPSTSYFLNSGKEADTRDIGERNSPSFGPLGACGGSPEESTQSTDAKPFL